MSGLKSRTRNHRSNKNGTCQKISIAYCISTLNISFEDKIKEARSHPNYSGELNLYSDNRLLICFSDSSVLGFNETDCYVADSFGREDCGKKPSRSKRIASFV